MAVECAWLARCCHEHWILMIPKCPKESIPCHCNNNNNNNNKSIPVEILIHHWRLHNSTIQQFHDTTILIHLSTVTVSETIETNDSKQCLNGSRRCLHSLRTLIWRYGRFQKQQDPNPNSPVFTLRHSSSHSSIHHLALSAFDDPRLATIQRGTNGRPSCALWDSGFHWLSK